MADESEQNTTSTSKSQSFEITTFEEDHIPGIVEFWNETFSDRRNFLPMTPVLFRHRIMEVETTIESFNPDHFLIAKKENRVVGIMHVGIHPESFCEALYGDEWEGGEQGYVGIIAVHPEEREQGIGTDLWERGVDLLEHTSMIILDGQCLNPYYGNSLGPFQPFWGTTEGISISPDQRETIGFFAKRGFEPRYKGISLSRSLPPEDQSVEQPDNAEIKILENEYPAIGNPEEDRLPNPATSGYLVTQLIHDGQTAGLLAVYPFSSLPEEKWGIYEFQVEKNHRGQNFGELLLVRTMKELAEREADSCETLALEEVSEEALNLYKKHGFEQEATWLIY